MSWNPCIFQIDLGRGFAIADCTIDNHVDCVRFEATDMISSLVLLSDIPSSITLFIQRINDSMHVDDFLSQIVSALCATNASHAMTSEHRCIASKRFQLAVAPMLT